MKTLVLLLLIASRMVSGGAAYVQPFTVYAVDGERVTVESNAGDLFDFYGDGFTPGQAVAVLLDDAGTPDDITDDMIIDVWG